MKSTMLGLRWHAAAALALAMLFACSSGTERAGGPSSPSGSASPGAASSATASASTPAGGTGSPTPSVSPTGGGPGQKVDPRVARGSARVDESDSDAVKTGLPPSYADMRSVQIRGLGSSVRVTIVFKGTLPQRAPDSSTKAGTGIRLVTGGHEYALALQLERDGWKPAATRDRKTTRFPGTFVVSGDTVRIVFPWSFVSGPRRFDWTAFFVYSRSVTAALDVIPNRGEAHFPQ